MHACEFAGVGNRASMQQQQQQRLRDVLKQPFDMCCTPLGRLRVRLPVSVQSKAPGCSSTPRPASGSFPPTPRCAAAGLCQRSVLLLRELSSQGGFLARCCASRARQVRERVPPWLTRRCPQNALLEAVRDTLAASPFIFQRCGGADLLVRAVRFYLAHLLFCPARRARLRACEAATRFASCARATELTARAL